MDDVTVAVAGDCSNWRIPAIEATEIAPGIADFLAGADLFVFNLEGPLVDDRIRPSSPYPAGAGFLLGLAGKRQPLVTGTAGVLRLLKRAPVNVACLANNHILDAGERGIVNTANELSANGFRFLGAGRDAEEASKPVIVEVRGTRVAILNYNFVGLRKFGVFVNVFGAGKHRAGANYAPPDAIAHAVARLRQSADHVLGFFHIGRIFSDALAEPVVQMLSGLGFDFVGVTHSHTAQRPAGSILPLGDFLLGGPDDAPPRGGRVAMVSLSAAPRVEHREIAIAAGLPTLT